MKKRVKLFSAGEYGKKGKYGIDDLKKMISNTKDTIKAQFVHTSHWDKLNKEKGKNLAPIQVGEFSNLGLKNDSVYADVEFNDLGNTFFDNGIIDKLSVELSDGRDAFTKVAALPLGVKQAVSGAEFEESLEFEIEFEMDDSKILGMPLEEKLETIKKLANSINKEHRDIFRSIMYEFEKEAKEEFEDMNLQEVLKKATEEEKREAYKILGLEFEEKPEPKTEEEIRAEVAKEFELKGVEKELKSKLENIPPVLRPAMEFAIEKACEAEESEKTYEFEVDGEKVEKTKVAEFAEILDGLKMPTGNLATEFQRAEQKTEDANEIAEKKLAPYLKK